MYNKIFNRKQAAVATFASLAFGLMAGCSDDANSVTAQTGTATTGETNPCLYEGYTAVAGTDGATLCMDPSGNLSFWINADGSYGFPEAAVADPCNGQTSMVGDDGTTYCIDAAGNITVAGEEAVASSASTATDATVDPTVDPTVASSASTDPTVDPTVATSSSAATVTTCTEADGTVVNQKTVIYGADGSTYMYNSNCTKITLSEPASSSSISIPQAISSSSAAVSPTSSATVANSSSSAFVFPTSSSATVYPTSSSATVTPASSSSIETVITSATSATSNGNTPAIAYASSGATVTNNNGCVTVNGGETVITCAGDYDFSGSYTGSDAQIRVYSPKADSGVYLNLRGLTLTNSADAPIYVQMASKAFVVAKSGTTNTLTDGSSRSKEYSYVNNSGTTVTDTTNAAIYSKDDLTLKGEGILKVTGNYNNGIQSSNDLRVKNGEITVTAKNNGLKGKGSVQISGGTVSVTTTEGDGIKSDEGEDENTLTTGKGVVVITGGTMVIKSGDDGIQAWNQVHISEADATVSINITAGSGSPDKTASSNNGFGGGNMNSGFNSGCRPGSTTCTTSSSSTTTTTSASSKGIVGADSVIIDAGTIEVASYKDAIHSNGYVNVNGGNLTLAGRNAIHADEIITINDGTIYGKDSYEAFEARQILAKGGVTATESSNDGWNASTGNEGCTGNCKIEVTGGVHYLHIGSGDTDGMDSNGDINLSGGVIVVECQINGGQGGSFDSDGSASITSKALLGFSPSRSEAGTSYNVNFSTSSYYGNSYIAFKPNYSGSYIQATSQPSAVSSVSSYSKSTTFPNGYVVYYNN